MTSGLVTFEDLARMKKEILGASAPASIVQEVAASTKFRRLLSADLAIGRALTGPQFIDTVAIQDGAVTAEKLVASLVLSTEIIAGAASPADRLTLDSTGVKAYASVNGVANTEYFSLTPTGLTIGAASGSQLTYVNSTGVLTVPAAVISGLTIADVGTGSLGGTYSTSGGTARIEWSSGGFRAYNSAGNRTVDLTAANGNFELNSDPVASSRLKISPSGIELYKGGTREFYLQGSGATNAITMLLTGPGVSDYIGMNPTDGLWLGASTYAGASTKFRVSPAGVLNATSAVISGAITATSGSLQTLSVDGTLTMGASGLIRTSATTTRLELDNGGIYGYNAGTQRFQVLGNGSGWLGSSSLFNWSSAGAVTIGGFTVNSTAITGGVLTLNSNGSISTGNFAVSTAGVMSATGATLTGALTATSLSITGTASFSGGTLTLPNGGSITSSSVNITGNSGGSNGNIDNMNVANLDVDGTITIASGGSIVDGDGSSWTQSGLILVSSGTFGDAIRWRTSGVDRGSIYTTSSGMTLSGGAGSSSDGFLILTSGQVTLTTSGASGPSLVLGSSASSIYRGATIQLDINSSHYVSTASRIYPGSGSIQSTRYLYDSGSHLGFGGVTVGGSAGNWSTDAPAGAAYFSHVINGVICRIPFYANG